MTFSQKARFHSKIHPPNTCNFVIVYLWPSCYILFIDTAVTTQCMNISLTTTGILKYSTSRIKANFAEHVNVFVAHDVAAETMDNCRSYFLESYQVHSPQKYSKPGQSNLHKLGDRHCCEVCGSCSLHIHIRGQAKSHRETYNYYVRSWYQRRESPTTVANHKTRIVNPCYLANAHAQTIHSGWTCFRVKIPACKKFVAEEGWVYFHGYGINLNRAWLCRLIYLWISCRYTLRYTCRYRTTPGDTLRYLWVYLNTLSHQ